MFEKIAHFEMKVIISCKFCKKIPIFHAENTNGSTHTDRAPQWTHSHFNQFFHELQLVPPLLLLLDLLLLADLAQLNELVSSPPPLSCEYESDECVFRKHLIDLFLLAYYVLIGLQFACVLILCAAPHGFL